MHFSAFKFGAGTQLEVIDPFFGSLGTFHHTSIPSELVTSSDKVTFVFITKDETNRGFEIHFEKGMTFDLFQEIS